MTMATARATMAAGTTGAGAVATTVRHRAQAEDAEGTMMMAARTAAAIATIKSGDAAAALSFPVEEATPAVAEAMK
jgi:hypothetical protein